MAKKNNTAQKALLEAEALTESLKKGTEKTLQSLLNEAISDIVSSEDDEDEVKDDETEDTIEDNSYEEEEVETEDNDETETDDTSVEDEEGSDKEEDDEEWLAKIEGNKVGDDDFDLTSVDDDTAFEVWSKIGDKDLVHIQKQDDGTYEIKDDNTGADLVVDIEGDSTEDDADIDADDTEAGTDAEDDELEIDIEDGDTETDVDIEDDETEDAEEDSEDDELELDFDNTEEEDEDEIETDEDETLDENLGYTDNYQKDVFAKKMNMGEPARKDATYSMDGGVPKGSEKPWAGKWDSKGYTKTGTDLAESEEIELSNDFSTEEIDENQTTSKSQRRKMVKTYAPNSGEKDKPEVSKEVSIAGELTEAKVRKLVELSKRVLEENKKYKAKIQEIMNENKKSLEAIGKVRQSLQEAYITNRSYRTIADILINETTTREEKKSIAERMLKVKTVEEGKTLAESIRRELHAAHKTGAPRLDEQISAVPSSEIDETVIYQTAKNNPSLNLLERMERIPELNGRKRRRLL